MSSSSADPPPPPPLPPLQEGWTEIKDANGRVYYVNSSIGKSQWTHPTFTPTNNCNHELYKRITMTNICFSQRFHVGLFLTALLLGAAHLLPQIRLLPSTAEGTLEQHAVATNIQREPGNRRYFVLHIGPAKSGTTSIQRFLDEKRISKLLKFDRYKYIGNERGVLNVRNGKLQPMNATTGRYEFSEAFKKTVHDEFHRDGYHIVGSNEHLRGMLNPEQIREWKNMFAATADGAIPPAKNLTLRVVLTYRRFHDYLPSQWNQQYRFKRYNGKHYLHEQWPGIEHDYKILSFPDYFVQRYYKNKSKSRPHTAYEGYKSWKDVADEIVLVNFHQKTNGENMDIVTNFVCNALPGAEHTCLALRKGEAMAAATNPAKNLDYDMLAVRAYEAGLVQPPSLERPKVAQAIQRRVEANNLVLPQACLNETVAEYFYQKSLEYEQWFFSMYNNGNLIKRNELESDGQTTPAPLTPEQLSDFNEHWDKVIAKQKFCSVDVDAAIEDEEWRSFFRNMSKHV